MKLTYLFVLVLLINFSCSEKIIVTKSDPILNKYNNPLFVVTYNYWTKFLNKRLTKHLELNFGEQHDSVSFLVIEQPTEEFQMKRDFELISPQIDQQINGTKSDIIILIYPTSTTMALPGAAIVKASYKFVVLDVSQQNEILNGEIHAVNHANSNVRTKKIATILLQELINRGVLSSNAVIGQN